MSTCSYTIHVKKISVCSKVFVEWYQKKYMQAHACQHNITWSYGWNPFLYVASNMVLHHLTFMGINFDNRKRPTMVWIVWILWMVLVCCIEVNLDIFSNFELFGCFNSIIRSYNTLMIYLNFMEDVWILGDYLNFVLLKYDEKTQSFIFWCCLCTKKTLNNGNTINMVAIILSIPTLHILSKGLTIQSYFRILW